MKVCPKMYRATRMKIYFAERRRVIVHVITMTRRRRLCSMPAHHQSNQLAAATDQRTVVALAEQSAKYTKSAIRFAGVCSIERSDLADYRAGFRSSQFITGLLLGRNSARFGGDYYRIFGDEKR